MKATPTRRMTFSVCCSLAVFGIGILDVRGDDNGAQLLLVSATAIIVFVATFLYIPVVKKVEPGSPGWWYGLIFSTLLLALGLVALIAGYPSIAGALMFFATTILALRMGDMRLDGKKRP